MFRDLVITLTWRDIKIKYKQSLMGMLWAVIMPAIIVLAGMLVRLALTRMSGTQLVAENLASISVKALPWAFVVGGLRFATNSLAGNAALITKINCPRIAFPVSAVLSALFDLVIAILPLMAVLAWCGIRVGSALAWVPLLLALLVLQVGGLGIVLATANLFFRDVKYIVEIVLTFAIFFTPVIYDADMLGAWHFWVMLNPVAPLLEGLRSAVVLDLPPDPGWLAYSAIVSAVLALAGWKLFHRFEPAFADNA